MDKISNWLGRLPGTKSGSTHIYQSRGYRKAARPIRSASMAKNVENDVSPTLASGLAYILLAILCLFGD